MRNNIYKKTDTLLKLKRGKQEHCQKMVYEQNVSYQIYPILEMAIHQALAKRCLLRLLLNPRYELGSEKRTYRALLL